MFVFFLNILRQKSGRYVCVQLLQTLNILFENISHETSLCKDHFWGCGLSVWVCPPCKDRPRGCGLCKDRPLGVVVSWWAWFPLWAWRPQWFSVGVASCVRPTLAWACFPYAFVSLLWMSLPGWV